MYGDSNCLRKACLRISVSLDDRTGVIPIRIYK